MGRDQSNIYSKDSRSRNGRGHARSVRQGLLGFDNGTADGGKSALTSRLLLLRSGIADGFGSQGVWVIPSRILIMNGYVSGRRRGTFSALPLFLQAEFYAEREVER